MRRRRHAARLRGLSELEISRCLDPFGQGVRAEPIAPPLTNNAPAVDEPAGACGEREFGDDGDFTG